MVVFTISAGPRPMRAERPAFAAPCVAAAAPAARAIAEKRSLSVGVMRSPSETGQPIRDDAATRCASTLIARREPRQGERVARHGLRSRLDPHRGPVYRSFALAARLVEEPDAPLRLVDPHLDQARRRHVAVLFADVVHLA